MDEKRGKNFVGKDGGKFEKYLAFSARRYLNYIKQLWGPLPATLSYRDFLQHLTKAELDDIRRTWDIKKVSSLRKNELITVFTDSVSDKLTGITATFDRERFNLLKQLVTRGGVLPVNDKIAADVEYYRRKGIIFTGLRQEEKVICLPAELISPAEKLINREVEARIERNSEWIGLTHGILYYYGVMGFAKLQETLEQLTKKPVDPWECIQVLADAMDYYQRIRYCNEGYCDERVEDSKEIVKEQHKRPDIDYRSFSKSQLLEAGQENFIEWTPELHSFRQFLKQNYEISKAEIEELIGGFMDLIRADAPVQELFDYLQNVLEFPSFDSVQQITAVINPVMNATSRWILRGHTPNQIFKTEQQHVNPLPSAPFAVQRQPGEVFDFATRRKVGRNDPCPCGSGKKYKKCCGRDTIE
ncbi:MAG: SEC-C metal-binding domain-containing protein [Veillonellales bacterium]